MYTCKKHERENDSTNAIIQALDNTSVLMFMYYPQTRTVIIPKKTSEFYRCKTEYTDMPQSFADEFIYEEDHFAIKELYRRINCGEKQASAVFRSKDLDYCANVTLTTINWTEDKKPAETIGIIEDKSDFYKNEKLVNRLRNQIASYNSIEEMDEVLKIMASTIGSQYFAVYYVWLESRTFVCFQEQMEGVLSIIGERGAYEPAWDKYIMGFIEETYHEEMRKFVDISTLVDRIGLQKSITCVYKRKKLGWARGSYVVGKRDKSGKPLTLVYIVSDINEEMETKQKKDEAEQEMLRDTLTRLLNRKAFDRYKEAEEYRNNQTGIIVFDIDRFKAINDQYGHEAGDQVIIAVADKVKEALRQNDYVFRMGGDEFAVLLSSCNASIWEIVCRMIEKIHSNIRSSLPEGSNVTISAGICVNEDGYCDEMYNLADRAMFNTKKNGRGGCTLIDSEGQIVKEWHDNSAFLRKGEVLEKNSTVTWRLDKPKKEGLLHRVYGDELFCSFVGLDNSATPEEVYQAWAERVKPDNFDIIREAAKTAISAGKVEVVFDWNHPEKGLIQLRCSAFFEGENEDYYTFIGFIHVISGIHVITMEDIDAKIKNAMEKMYFCSFYIRLSDYSFKIHKAQPYVMDMLERSENAVEAAEAYIRHMVSDESKETMTEFLDMTTLRKRMKNTCILAADYHDPNIGWSRAKFVTVDRDKNADAENVLLVVEEKR